VRNPTANTDAKREASIADACKLLEPLTKPARSWSVVSWNEPDASDPRDVFECAVEFVIALLDPAPPPPPNSDQAKTYDIQAQQAADEFLGVHASIVRKVVLPALRLGRPPKRKGPRRGGNLLRYRWIAAVVTIICQRHDLDPYRNPLSEHRCNGFSVVAEALTRLEIGLDEDTVRTIYEKHKQA
jgi:hypothetical protein